MNRNLRVRIVCYENINAWILGKFARKLCENLKDLGVDADISGKVDPKADINHHIIYIKYNGRKSSVDTVMVTHIDTPGKLKMLANQQKVAEMFVCTSSDTLNKLSAQGILREKLCFILPAHDSVVKPKKYVVGITSKVQPTGCKREYFLDQVSSKIDLSRSFKFKIMGAGWKSIVAKLRNRGVEVEYFDQFDYDRYVELIPNLDYYLYFGLDEGSMGFIDALAAGIKTITTPQGFHLDAAQGITHPFIELSELTEVFSKIILERECLIQSVSDWTWSEYARKHLLMWKYLLSKKNGVLLDGSAVDDLVKMGVRMSV